MSVKIEIDEGFGRTSKEEAVKKFRLTNDNGMLVEVMDFGATVLKLCTKDR